MKTQIVLLPLTLLLSIVFPLSGFSLQTQDINIPSSPNPVGSGARALGMGGAFIAISDDATAASWNPGGLTNLERPEISVVLDYFSRKEKASFTLISGSSSSPTVSKVSLNYLSVAYPTSFLGKPVVFSINHQRLLDFTSRGEFRLDQSAGPLVLINDYLVNQEGGVAATGLAGAVALFPEFSIGITFNSWRNVFGENGWEETTVWTGDGTLGTTALTDKGSSKKKYSFEGYNVNIGFLYTPSNFFTIGGVVKTPFSAKLRFDQTFSDTLTLSSTSPTTDTTSFSSSMDETLDMPLSFGLGIALRFSDRLTLSLDAFRTEWQDFILTDPDGNRTSLISGFNEKDADIGPTTQIRVGGEYLFIFSQYVIPLRGGLFYDPAPAEKNPDDFYGLSLGSGLGARKFSVDLLYQLRYGNNVGSSGFEHLGFSEDVTEHSLFSSLILYL